MVKVKSFKILTLIFLVSLLTISHQPSAIAMQLLVQIVGSGNLILEVEPSDTIENVKQKIQDKEGIPAEQQSIYLDEILLEDVFTLLDYNVKKDDILWVVRTINNAAIEAARVAAIEAARVAAAEAARVAVAEAEAARKAKEQKELIEILALIPKIGGLALSLGDTTKSLYSTKCVKGKTTKYVKYGAKCPKGFVRK